MKLIVKISRTKPTTVMVRDKSSLFLIDKIKATEKLTNGATAKKRISFCPSILRPSAKKNKSPVTKLPFSDKRLLLSMSFPYVKVFINGAGQCA